jgi:HSP20 family protein
MPIDMYQTPNEVVIKAALPGIKPEDVDIGISGDTLTIKGEAKVEEEIEEEDYLCQEHRYGSFSRSVTLPSSLSTDKAEADFENGMLTLTIPKAEEVKPRMIKVKAKGEKI